MLQLKSAQLAIESFSVTNREPDSFDLRCENFNNREQKDNLPTNLEPPDSK